MAMDIEDLLNPDEKFWVEPYANLKQFLSDPQGEAAAEPFLEKGLRLYPDRPAGYAHFGTGVYFWERNLYLHTPMAIGLAAGDRPLAWVGFLPWFGRLDIRQIQGIKGEKEALDGLGRWEQNLVGLAESYARYAQMDQVQIQPAESNRYVLSGDYPLRLARRRYDLTAQKLDYNYSPNDRRYVKKLG